MKAYLVAKFKGKGSTTGDLYYEIKVYSDEKKNKDISEEFFEELNSKSSLEFYKKYLIFNDKKKSIIFKHGFGNPYSLLKTVYSNDKVRELKDYEYIISNVEMVK